MSAPSRSRLNKFLNIAGGITLGEATERADANMQTLAPRSEADMAEALASIGHYLAAVSGAPSPAVRQEMHRLSCVIVSLGGTFGREALSKAGYNFCRLLDELGESWDEAAVSVHVNAMRLLFLPDGLAPEAQAQIVEGLNKVRVKAVTAARKESPPPIEGRG